MTDVVGPILNGWIIEASGSNYNLIFLVTPAFFLLAILCMLAVTRGEAKAVRSLAAHRPNAGACPASASE